MSERSIGSVAGARTATEVVFVDPATGEPGFPAGAGSTAREVQGNTASNAADVGKPVKAGGVYQGTDPAGLVPGQRGDLTLDANFNLRTKLVGNAVAAVDGASNGLTFVSGHNSNGTSDSGRPLGVGAFVFNGTSWDRSRGDANGTVVTPHALAASRWSYAGVSGGITTTSDVTLIAAGGTSVRNYLSALQYINTSAVASEIVVKEGSTVLWRGYAPAAMTQAEKIMFEVPLRAAPNTPLTVALLTTATATIVSAQGFRGV